MNGCRNTRPFAKKSLPGKSNPTRLSVRSMKVLLALFCSFFVNLIKKSLTTRFGVSMPMIGYGTFQITDAKQCRSCVADALAAGYRLVDTAAA